MCGSKNPVKVDDAKVHCFRDDLNGMYLYWQSDAAALAGTASTFNAGYLALAGIGELALGVVGTTFVMLKGRKKKEETAA